MSKTQLLPAAIRKRSRSAALKQMRREGLVPAVVYGAHQENINLKVSAKTFAELLQESSGQQFLVNLDIEGQGGAKLALIQDVQHDALTGNVLHIDFHAVREDEQIHSSVPVELIGDSIGIKQGGVLDHQLHSLEIDCYPRDLPEKILGDISNIDIGDGLHVKDLHLPEGVATDIDGDVVVALVAKARLEELEEEAEEGVAEEGAEPGAVAAEPAEK